MEWSDGVIDYVNARSVFCGIYLLHLMASNFCDGKPASCSIHTDHLMDRFVDREESRQGSLLVGGKILLVLEKREWMSTAYRCTVVEQSL